MSSMIVLAEKHRELELAFSVSISEGKPLRDGDFAVFWISSFSSP
eukprot:CAMPEP_0185271998 /NCGR_PEP_ID=MMETSP1359-20130426/46103_1 /TAXON_ID=552665 /ORGANISM="Bigelowiella longifila, Strain CCMP242" /LENGTH=44 /DNA_ID= /DNA_START= /DNA_END= /DNA_ORIENTATION=